MDSSGTLCSAVPLLPEGIRLLDRLFEVNLGTQPSHAAKTALAPAQPTRRASQTRHRREYGERRPVPDCFPQHAGALIFG